MNLALSACIGACACACVRVGADDASPDSIWQSPTEAQAAPWAPGTRSRAGSRDGSNVGGGGIEAVTHGDGPLCILAGPGSGKTRVITRRIAWLVRERNVRPDEILAITFTNKAAREMRERIEELLPDGALKRGWISTFHSMCARILRRDIELLGRGYTRDFTIYDTHDRN